MFQLSVLVPTFKNWFLEFLSFTFFLIHFIQVLSTTVADTFASRNLNYTVGTEEFIRLSDQFFDCLNVTNTYQGKKQNKPALYPYEDADDWRLKVLTTRNL